MLTFSWTENYSIRVGGAQFSLKNYFDIEDVQFDLKNVKLA